MTLKEQYEKNKQELIDDASYIATATDYSKASLFHGSACDSSVRSGIRMEFVMQAQTEFITMNKSKILKRAAKLCLESIGEK